MSIRNHNAIEAWKEAINKILTKGELVIDQHSRRSLEVQNLVVEVEDAASAQEPVLELIKQREWVYPELEEIKEATLNIQDDNNGCFTYGSRMLGYAGTLNQIDDYVVPLLEAQPSSRRAVIITYNPLTDSNAKKTQVPGMICVMFRIKEKKLNVTAVLRSNDMFMGWPANIYQASLIQAHIAQKLGLEKGSITTISHSAHVFEEHKEIIATIQG